MSDDKKITLELSSDEIYMVIGGLLMMNIRLAKDTETALFHSYREKAKEYLELARKIDRVSEGQLCAAESSLAMAFEFDDKKKKWKKGRTATPSAQGGGA